MQMIDVDYALFMKRLLAAGTAGLRIEKTDKKRWAAYVREHKIMEAASMVHARAICESMVPVIIDTEDDWNGYYLYSREDLVCVKYDPGR